MRTARVRRPVFAACATVALSVVVMVSCKGTGRGDGDKPPAPTPVADFRLSPPSVEKATIQPLAQEHRDGNALLEVEFERGDRRVEKGVPIFPHGEQVTLRDDGKDGDTKKGDGVFSAIIPFDFKELAQQAAIARDQLQRPEPKLIFRGREIIGVEDPKTTEARLKVASAFGNIDDLIRARTRFNIFDFVPSVSPASIDPARSLMITAPSVVADPARTINPCTGAGDPNGAWTFKHLVTEMVAGTGVDPADFVERWIRLWDSPQTVSSGFTAGPRSAAISQLLGPWPRVPATGKLDLDKSPFRLSAIVNRIDLGGNSIYGGGGAGEGRFVFGVLDRTGSGCNFLPFSVIFEYGIDKKNCHAVRSWAQEWVQLSSLTLGSPEYNAALQNITDQFTRAGAAPRKPNGSALNQLRTNEIAIGSPWELREFRINRATHLLFEDTTKQTVDRSLNNTTVLANYINTNAAQIILDRHVVPDRFPGTSSFMAAASLAVPGSLPAQLSTHFRAPGVTDNLARHHFSLNTCTGCHIRETATTAGPPTDPPASVTPPATAFLHVDPTTMPATLSNFLTGATPSLADSPDPFQVRDPVDGAMHNFNDLDIRRHKLAAKAGNLCIRSLIIPPLRLFERLPPIGPGGIIPPLPDPRFDGVNDPLRMVH